MNPQKKKYTKQVHSQHIITTLKNNFISNNNNNKVSLSNIADMRNLCFAFRTEPTASYKQSSELALMAN